MYQILYIILTCFNNKIVFCLLLYIFSHKTPLSITDGGGRKKPKKPYN